MALVKDIIAGALLAGMPAGLAGASRADQAKIIAAAYYAYALLGQSCAGLPPTLVQYGKLKEKLIKAMSGAYVDPIQPAKAWAAAFEAFWTGAVFGVSGLVILIPGTKVLEGQLIQLFAAPAPAPAFINGLSGALDAFTKLIIVQDLLVPPPTGCSGPIT